ncbi:MAG: SMC-Scp complex subunit ScpB [Clostridia bacterium]|nr:SMC-Scp complex subunit ScpB [Clostridia bacterium]
MNEDQNVIKDTTVSTDNDTIREIKNIEGAIEAILYAAGYPIKYQKLSEVIGLSVSDIKTIVEHMAQSYNENDIRGINLLIFEDSCQFCTKTEYAPYIREALGIRRGGNLSASSLEVLAVVAYNQPVTRTYIDTVRGVDSSYAVNSLIDKGLIESCGRLDAPGRPVLYATSEKFLRVFGINSLSELPETESLGNSDVGIQINISDIGEENSAVNESSADTSEGESQN